MEPRHAPADGCHPEALTKHRGEVRLAREAKLGADCGNGSRFVREEFLRSRETEADDGFVRRQAGRLPEPRREMRGAHPGYRSEGRHIKAFGERRLYIVDHP